MIALHNIEYYQYCQYYQEYQYSQYTPHIYQCQNYYNQSAFSTKVPVIPTYLPSLCHQNRPKLEGVRILWCDRCDNRAISYMTGVHLQHFFTFKVVKYWLFIFFIFFIWTATLWTRWEAVSLIILYSQHFSLFFSHCFVLWKAGPRQTWKKLKVSVSRILGPVITQ